MRSRVALPVALAVALLAPSVRAADPDPWLGTDKALHFGVSAAIAGGSYAAAAAVFDARGHALLASAGLTLGVGVGKEALDLAGFGDPSWRDVAADVAGTAVGLAIAWAIDLAVRGTGDAHPPLVAPRAAGALAVSF